MKIKIIDGVKGYVLSQNEIDNLQKMVIDGKECYFLKCKFRRSEQLNEQRVLELINSCETKKEIVEILDCTLSKLNNFLSSHYGTLVLDTIRNMNKK